MVSSRAALLSTWDSADFPVAPISVKQNECIREMQNRDADETERDKDGGNDQDDDHRSEGSGFVSATHVTKTGTVSSSASVIDPALFPAVRKLEKSGRLDTGEKFLCWLHSMENSLRERDDEPHRKYIELLERHRTDADQLLAQVEDNLDESCRT
jgi:hypothetical protein